VGRGKRVKVEIGWGGKRRGKYGVGRLEGGGEDEGEGGGVWGVVGGRKEKGGEEGVR